MYPVLPGRKVPGPGKAASMRRGAQQSPAGGRAGSALRSCHSSARLKSTHHLSITHFQRAFAASMAMTDTASPTSAQCRYVCIPRSRPTSLRPTTRSGPTEPRRIEGEDPADEDADPPSPERVRQGGKARRCRSSWLTWPCRCAANHKDDQVGGAEGGYGEKVLQRCMYPPQ